MSIFGKLLSEMGGDEAMDYAAERSAMESLGWFGGTKLLDDFEGRDVVELRRQLEIAIRVCVREAIRAKKCRDQIMKDNT